MFSNYFLLEERPTKKVNDTPKRHGITILFLLILFCHFDFGSTNSIGGTTSEQGFGK